MMELEYKILIVDDVIDNIQVAMSILKEESYNFSFATSGEAALELLKSDDFDLVLLDIMMPGIDGYMVCKQMKQDEKLADIPVIFLTAKADIDAMSKGFELGAVDYIVKPFYAESLLARVKTHLELYISKKILKHHNLSLQTKMEKGQKRLLTELEESQKEMIYMLTELMESSAGKKGQRVRRVSEYSRLLALYHPGISEEDRDVIYHSSAMLDIGKMLIPQSIVQKEGRLTDEECEIMKQHTVKAHKFLDVSDRKIMKAANIIAYEHHEQWNGNGYPRGLKGEEINIYGRIVALADVFDDLIHKQVDKEVWSTEEAVEHIIENSGILFDPYLVEIFRENLDDFIVTSKF